MDKPILDDFDKPLGDRQLAHELRSLQMQQEHDRKINEIRFKSLESEIKDLRHELDMLRENLELRRQLEIAEKALCSQNK